MFKELFERTQGGTWKGGQDEDQDEIQILVDEYDWYTHMIDSYPQQKKKNKINKQILQALKKLKVTEINLGQNKRKIDV